MSDFKTDREFVSRKLPDAVAVHTDTEETVRESKDLPVSTYADYKTWCDKVRQEWDVN